MIIVYCHRHSGAVECTLPNPLETVAQFLWKTHYLGGALMSSEVNTLNSSGSDPRKNVDRGATVVIYWSTWKKHEG